MQARLLKATGVFGVGAVGVAAMGSRPSRTSVAELLNCGVQNNGGGYYLLSGCGGPSLESMVAQIRRHLRKRMRRPKMAIGHPYE